MFGYYVVDDREMGESPFETGARQKVN